MNDRSTAQNVERQRAPDLVDLASRYVLWLARHWLALFNTAWGLYILLPLLAPVFMAAGWTVPAQMIYGGYRFMCHQLPDHSYFLFGESLAPSLSLLEANGMEAGLGMFEQRRFIGSESVGYKVAICQRDMAIYGSVFLAGLAYALFGRGRKGLHWKVFLLLLVPIALDGTTQLVGLRESNWWLRTLTGALFGAGAVWFAYPFVDGAMDDVIEDELRRNQRHPTTGL